MTNTNNAQTSTNNNNKKEMIMKNAKRNARLAFVFAPIVAAAYVCKGSAKAARAIETGARITAEKLEAADKSLTVKADAIKQELAEDDAFIALAAR